MKTPFSSGYRVTQAFGANPSYYKQFGLTAHEGIDLVPQDGRNTTVVALADGIVVKDEDNARSGAYGIYVTLWHPTLNRATQYCHLASNVVSNGQTIKAGEKLGTMGSTGNSTGPHLHLNLFATDDNGIRLNRDNGYLGGINPQPFLDEGGDPMTTELQACLADRKKFWKERDEARAEVERLKSQADNLNQQINDRNNDIAKLNASVNTLTAERDSARQQAATHEEIAKRVPQLEEQLAHASEFKQRFQAENDVLLKENKELKAENARILDDAPRALVRWVMRIVAGGGK